MKVEWVESVALSLRERGHVDDSYGTWAQKRDHQDRARMPRISMVLVVACFCRGSAVSLDRRQRSQKIFARATNLPDLRDQREGD
jgi:hypothetical protein